jgi:lambda repressor-like predicted transcriptional regulator
MVNVMDKNQIISMHKQGESIKSISKKLGIARNTLGVTHGSMIY